MKEIIIPTNWTPETYANYRQSLYTEKDEKYYSFNKKIVFTNHEMIGIRVPILRSISKKISKTNYMDFLQIATLNTYEEIFIYGTVISYIKEYDTFLKHFDKLIKYIDTWALCDMLLSSFKIIKKNKRKFQQVIEKLLDSKKEFYVRVGVVSLLYYYVEKEELSKLFKCFEKVKHRGHYVHMAIAWAISIIYTKFPIETEEYLKNNNLNKKTVNKAIQKIRESRRIDDKTKNHLLKYKK